jgi:hypothetical protein
LQTAAALHPPAGVTGHESFLHQLSVCDTIKIYLEAWNKNISGSIQQRLY